jgi:hypothetical protein
METELALPKFGPQQAACGYRDNHQRDHCLPIRIHAANIDPLVALAKRFSVNAPVCSALDRPSCGRLLSPELGLNFLPSGLRCRA